MDSRTFDSTIDTDHLIDHHRMDDDGAPPPDILPFNIGIPPETKKPRTGMTLYKEQQAELAARANARDELGGPAPDDARSTLFFPGVTPTDTAPAQILDPSGKAVSSLTWPKYAAWRKTKCRPFDYGRGPKLATPEPVHGAHFDDCTLRIRAIEEIDQATHELVGEFAELAELWMLNGPDTLYGDLRKKLIDEVGDIFFCAMWAMDAWGVNPLVDATDEVDLELVEAVPGSPLAALSHVIATEPREAVLTHFGFIASLAALVNQILVEGHTRVGLTSNSFKKLKFQRRAQDVRLQVERILSALVMANQILILANATVAEALQSNQRKLDARFPLGYQPGVGGGIRTGEGA